MLFVLISAASTFLVLKQPRPVPAAKPAPAVSSKPVTPPEPEFREVTAAFEKGQTITYALAKQGLPPELINQIIDCARPVYNLAKIKAGQAYSICFTRDGTFRDFRYPVDDERYLTVYHDVKQDRLVSVMNSFSYENRLENVSAVIDESLFSAVMNIGERDQLAMEIAEIFGSDIDFHTDIQKGDSFSVLIEKKYLDGQFSKYGPIMAASFSNKDKVYAGFRFEDENGKPAYYAADGRSLKRSFLKSPLKFGRVTSRFSRARMHPILKILRPHLGVDYAAPVGTPVQAVGAGRVASAGYSGGSGKMIRISHTAGYESMYLHLSRIAVKPGAHVSQGQVIGYVGSTGMSTGPHLDFRVRRNGAAINPLKVIFPPGAPVSRNKFEAFAALRDKLNDELRMTNDELKQTRRASF